MSIITTILATLVALEHFYIFYLESMATQSDATSRVFNMNKEELARPSVTSLFKNQGIYNALIGVFLIYGIYFSHSLEIVTIFVLFVIGAATYGALTADKKNHFKTRWAGNLNDFKYPFLEIKTTSTFNGGCWFLITDLKLFSA